MIITGKGHPNICATHPTTMAFTRDKEVTPKGDCFVAVNCDWKVTPEFLESLRKAEKVTITIDCGGQKEVIIGHGHPDLTLTDSDLVIRKSDWVDSRTLMLGADKSAKDLSKEVVQCLKESTAVQIKVEVS